MSDGVKGRWPLLLAVVFVLAGIGTPLLGLKVFAGTDLLGTRPPWSAAEPTGFSPQLACVTDTVDAVLPQAGQFHRRLLAGDVASWDPYNAGGSPLSSVPSSALASPLSLPYVLLPTWLAPGFVKLLELVVAIGGMFLFLRRVGAGRAGAWLGGLAFGSSGFLVVWTTWQHSRVAAFIPALFWACERLVQRRRPADAALIAGVVAAMLLGGFPAVTGLALYAAAPYLLVRLWLTDRRPSRVAGGAVLGGVGLLTGIALVGIQLLPFVNQLGTIERRAQDGQHFPFFALVTTVVPDAFGDCTGSRNFGPENPIEFIAFAGGTVVLLALAGLAIGSGFARGVRGYLAGALALVLVLGWVGGPLLVAAQQLPVFSDNYIGRIRVLLGFLLAALAGLGYDALARRAPARRLVAGAVWAAAALLFAVVLVRTVQYVDSRDARPLFTAAARLPLAVGLLALVLLAAARVRRDDVRRGALLLLPVLVLVESLAFVVPFWPRVDRDQFYPETGAHRYLAEHLGGDRFGAQETVLYPATGSVYGLRAVTGHTFTAPAWSDLLKRIDPDTFVTSTFSWFPADAAAAAARSPVLDRLSVRYFGFAPTSPPLGDGLTVGTAAGTTRLADGRPVEVTVPVAALRAAGPVVAEPLIRPRDRFARLDVQVLAADGSVVATSSRRLGNGVRAAPFLVAVPAERARGLVRVRLTVHGAALKVATTAAGVPVVAGVTATDDGLRLAYADAGIVLYERLRALPRIRWAARAVAEPDPAARIGRVAAGLPADTVLLDGPGRADGRPARVEVLEDSGDTIRARVAADGAGYLVVADALQHDWRVSVDGRPARLRPADHALVAVDVPAGTHEVTLAYAPGGRPLGTVVTGLGALLVVALLLAGRRRRPRPPEPDGRELVVAEPVRLGGQR